MAESPNRRRLRSILIAVSLCVPALLTGCAAQHRRALAPAPDPGGRYFQNYCAACHQYDGQGMGDAPPLAGSPWVTGPEDRLIRIVLHGVRGRMEIEGKIYDQEMPGFGQILSDRDLAALLSFLRGRFGAPGAPVTAESVSRIRAANQSRTRYWSVEELLGKP
jgi:mono/diheme cytochrome c family protein